MYLSFICPLYILSILFYLKKYKISTYSGIATLIFISFILFYLSSINFLIVLLIFFIFTYINIRYCIKNLDNYFDYILKYRIYVVVSICYACLTFAMYGGGEGIGHRIAISLWPSVDNNLYLIVARQVCDYGSRAWAIPIFGEIPLADRVPAVGLLTTPLYCAFRSETLVYSLGVSIQALWVIPTLRMIKLYGKPSYYILIIATSPIIIFYTTYLWWKILAATFLIIALNRIFIRESYGYYLPISFIIHPGSVYSFPYFMRFAKPTKKTLVVVSMAIIIIALSIAFLHPTGQIMRWHLFGDINVHGSFIGSLKNAYFIEFNKIVNLKISNIGNTILPIKLAMGVLETREAHYGLLLRYIQLYGIYTNILIYLFLIKYNKTKYDNQLILFVLISSFFAVLIEYGGDSSEAILHHRSFAELLVLFILVATHLRGPTFLFLGVIINILNLIIIWQPLENVDNFVFNFNYEELIMPIITILMLYLPRKIKL